MGCLHLYAGRRRLSETKMTLSEDMEITDSYNKDDSLNIYEQPAGLTATIYAERGGLKPLVISGYDPGGQLTFATDVENFPGFPEAIQGADLMENMRKQAKEFGTRFVDRSLC